MKQTLGLLVASFALVCLTMAQNQSQDLTARASSIRGKEWLEFTEERRLFYIIGAVDAENFYRGTLTHYSDKWPEIREFLLILDVQRPAFGRTEIQTIADGVDDFYKNPANRNIHVQGALRIVAMQVGGRSQREIDETLQELRRVFLK